MLCLFRSDVAARSVLLNHGPPRVHLTELVEECVDAVRPWDGTHQPGFDEGAPFVHQHSLASYVILEKTNTSIEHQPSLSQSKKVFIV